MKKYFFFTVFMLLLFNGFSQSPVGEGGKQINFGTGLSNYGMPLYFGMDFGVHPDITAGFVLSARSYGNIDYGSSGLLVIGVAGVGNYHFNRLLELDSEWDLYAGLSLGFVHWNYDKNYPNAKNSPLGLDIQVGGRYYWSDWGVNVELGGGNALTGFRIGLSYKL
jgi:outer membrane immunogenic protein